MMRVKHLKSHPVCRPVGHYSSEASALTVHSKTKQEKRRKTVINTGKRLISKFGVIL